MSCPDCQDNLRIATQKDYDRVCELYQEFKYKYYSLDSEVKSYQDIGKFVMSGIVMFLLYASIWLFFGII